MPSVDFDSLAVGIPEWCEIECSPDILVQMNEGPYWTTIWEEDIQGPLRHFIRQGMFLAFTALLQLILNVLKSVGVPQWLQEVFQHIVDGVAVVEFAAISAVILVGT